MNCIKKSHLDYIELHNCINTLNVFFKIFLLNYYYFKNRLKIMKIAIKIKKIAICEIKLQEKLHLFFFFKQ